MVINLAERYTNANNQKNDMLLNFVRNIDIEIVGYGSKQDMDFTSFGDLMFPNFLLVYFIKGNGRLQHGNQTMELKPGTIYLLKPFELFHETRTSKETLDYLYIYFDLRPIAMRLTFRQYAFRTGDKFYQQEWTQRVRPLLEELRDVDKTLQFQQTFLLHYTIHNLIANVLYEQTPNSMDSLVDNAKKINLVDRAFVYVEEHLDEPLDLGDVVNGIGTSRSSLNRVFKTVLQISPSKALTRFKIESALKLMRNGTSVKYAAKAVGYSSSFHFSRIFKSIMGKSPTEYLKM